MPMGKKLVYAREDRIPYIAFSHAMGRDIPQYDYFIDKAGEQTQLAALLKTTAPGDTVIVGTITDFMLPEIDTMLNILEDFADNDVNIESRLEPDYSIDKYRSAIRLADTIYRVRMSGTPI